MAETQYETRIKKVWRNTGEWFAGVLENNMPFAGNHPFGEANMEGVRVRIRGPVKTGQYGAQLKIRHVEMIDDDPMVFFLSRMVKGIGEKKANQMVDKYGADTIADWLNNSPRSLLKVHGIGPKTLKKIVRSWEQNKHMETIAKALAPLGLTRTMIVRIYRHFQDKFKGRDLADSLVSNVYMLTEVAGIGFKSIDQKALRGGLTTPDSPYRIAAAMIYTLEQAGDFEGHSCLHIDDLFARLDDVLCESAQEHDFYRSITERLIKDRQMYLVGDNAVSLRSVYWAERKLMERFTRMASATAPAVLDQVELDAFLENIQHEAGLRYDPAQIDAIASANSRYLNFVVGYAGTGKTTVTFGILKLLEHRYGRQGIYVTALSGVATDRVRKASGYAGGTIQSLLVNAKGAVIPYDVLVLDEASMVNSELMSQLLSLLKEDVRLVIVGDGGQLPPIGAGDPFMDAVRYRLGPVNELTKIHRQSEGSKISEYAGLIRTGQMPDFSQKADDIAFRSFTIGNLQELKKTHSVEELARLRLDNNNRIASYLAAAMGKLAPRITQARSSVDISKFLYTAQIITPMREGPLGAGRMNALAQSIITPDKEGELVVTTGGGMVSFRAGDKVMHLKNENMPCLSEHEFTCDPYAHIEKDSMHRVFNGFIGMVRRIDLDQGLLWVQYLSNNSIVRYTVDQVKDLLGLGYAMTIHKSQGSGFDYVMVPVTMSHYQMLNTRLFYTAITRAQKFCLIAGEPQALRAACTNLDASQRDTVMKRIAA